MTGLFGPDAMFAFKWQVALHGEPLSDAEMRQLATAASPVLKLRGAWTVVDPQVARKAKKRLIRTITPVQAVAAALTGTVEVEEGQSLLQALLDAGISMDYSCEGGVCGTCMVPLVSGEVEHLDEFLMDDEKDSNMITCVSRGEGEIEIDV